MPDRLTDPIDPADPFEGRLHARVRAYSEHGVRPIDAAAIAHDVAGDGRRARRFPAIRPGATLAFGALAIALVAVVALGSQPGGRNQPGAGALPLVTPGSSSGAASPGAPAPASATPEPAVVMSPATCQLSARITAWTGAAGHRIASVTLVNEGAPCHVSTTARVELVDANGTVLLRGSAAGSGDVLTLGTGEALTTEVDDDNYCGDIPIPPVTLAFVWSNGTRTVAEPAPPTGLGGVPPCNGDPGSAGHITMQPWQR